MSLCLPLLHISPPPPPPHHPMAIVAEPPQFHVLAVDDSITDRKLIEKLLKTSSFHVTTVDSGSKALEFLGLMEDHPPSVPSFHQEVEVNLVITDYCMPGMSGYDLLKKIKESSSLKDMPVVIMSSENAPSRINRCLEEGAKEFLLKPVKLSDMKKLRPHILRGQSKEEEEEEAGDPQDLQKKRKRKAMAVASDEEEEEFAPDRKTRTSCSQRPMQRGGKPRLHALRGQCKEEVEGEEAGDPQDLQQKRKRKAMAAAAEEEEFAPESKGRQGEGGGIMRQ